MRIKIVSSQPHDDWLVPPEYSMCVYVFVMLMLDIDWAPDFVFLLQITLRNAVEPAQKMDPKTAMDPETSWDCPYIHLSKTH